MYSKAVDNGVITIVEPPAGYIVNFDHPQQQYQIHVCKFSPGAPHVYLSYQSCLQLRALQKQIELLLGTDTGPS